MIVRQSAAVMESTTVVAGGIQKVSGEWIRFAQGSVEQNLDRFEQLTRCRTIQDCMALQTQIIREKLCFAAPAGLPNYPPQMADEAIRRIGNPSPAPR